MYPFSNLNLDFIIGNLTRSNFSLCKYGLVRLLLGLLTFSKRAISRSSVTFNLYAIKTAALALRLAIYKELNCF